MPMLKNKDPRKRGDTRMMAAVKNDATTAEISKAGPAKLAVLGKKTASIED